MPPSSAPRLISHWESARTIGVLRVADRVLPRPVFNVIAGIGVWIAVALLPRQRENSRRYLAAVLDRAVTARDVWRHYWHFLSMHLLRLKVADGQPHQYQPAPDCDDFAALMRSPRPALLGTFHLGNSDLLGFYLGQFGRHVHMVRFRLGDPRLLEQVARTCGAGVTFVWVNERDDLLFALKQAIDSGGTIAMKCDRDSYSSRRENFRFLGRERSFPFTIYYLGILFNRPVTFCISVPTSRDESTLHGFPIFEPDAGSKASNLLKARAHFQDVLTRIEGVLRTNPYIWFNFDSFAATPPTPDEPTPVILRPAMNVIDGSVTAK